MNLGSRARSVTAVVTRASRSTVQSGAAPDASCVRAPTCALRRLRRLSSFVTAVETLMKDGSNPGGAASHARSTSSGDRVRTRWRLKSSSPKSGWDGSRGGARVAEVCRSRRRCRADRVDVAGGTRRRGGRSAETATARRESTLATVGKDCLHPTRVPANGRVRPTARER